MAVVEEKMAFVLQGLELVEHKLAALADASKVLVSELNELLFELERVQFLVQVSLCLHVLQKCFDRNDLECLVGLELANAANQTSFGILLVDADAVEGLFGMTLDGTLRVNNFGTMHTVLLSKINQIYQTITNKMNPLTK